MSDLVEMLKAQAAAVHEAYLRGLELGRQRGYREGHAAGLNEACKIFEQSFPQGKLPAIATRQGE